MEIFFPAQTLSLMQVFAPCFTAPSFAYLQAYVWALMVVEGRKCMTRLARCAFFHPRDLSSWERFLAEHRWSLSAVTDRLVTLVVSKLGDTLQVHGAYLLGTDTTLVAKTAKRMLGVQKWKDHSDNADRGAYLIGHHGNLVGPIVFGSMFAWRRSFPMQPFDMSDQLRLTGPPAEVETDHFVSAFGRHAPDPQADQ